MDRELDLLLGEVIAAVAGLSHFETQAAPVGQPGNWSIHEIMEHLHLTYLSTARVIRGRIEKGRPTLTRPTTGQRLSKAMVLSFGYVPYGRKAPIEVSPSLPAAMLSGDELWERNRASLIQVDELTLQAERMFGNLPSVSHAVLGPLTMAEWRRFHLIHGRHHLKQIRALRQSHKF